MAKTLRNIHKTIKYYKERIAILEAEETNLLLPQKYIYDKWIACSRQEYNSIHEAYTIYTGHGGEWEFNLFSKLFIQKYQRRSYRDGEIVKKKYVKH